MFYISHLDSTSFLIGYTFWIDACQSGNLLASTGSDCNVKIFDKRESKVIQTFTDIHNSNIFYSFNKFCLVDWISCVRWSPAGDMIATSSWDKTVALLDFKTGKPLYTGETSDGSNLSLLTKSQSSLFPYQIWLCLSASFEIDQ